MYLVYLLPVFYNLDGALAYYPDNKVHGANMGPTWVLSAPDGPHVGPMSLAIRVVTRFILSKWHEYGWWVGEGLYTV